MPRALISAIPYEERLRRFHAEKNYLLRENPSRPAEEMDAITRRLAKKWRV